MSRVTVGVTCKKNPSLIDGKENISSWRKTPNKQKHKAYNDSFHSQLNLYVYMGTFPEHE